MLLEETERLNNKNVELMERVRLLEDGLASLQARVSDEVHPLLAKSALDAVDDSAEAAKMQREIDEINESLGTLTIDQDGRSLFLGNTAGVEVGVVGVLFCVSRFLTLPCSWCGRACSV